MALINCPECKKQVSEQAKTCPNCGFQIERYFYQKAREAKQNEQQEALNKKIAEREKQKQIRREKIKEHKKKYILISAISLVLVVALIVGSVLLFNKLQIRTFSSKEEMIKAVAGDYVDAEHFNNPYMFFSVNENYVTQSYELSIMDSDVYAIRTWDYENGKIIYGDDSEITVLKNGNLQSKTYTLSKKNYRYNLDFDISDVRWSEESGKTKCIVMMDGTIKKSYGKRIHVEGIAFSDKSKETQIKDLLRATYAKDNSLTEDYYFHNSIVEFEFNMTDVTKILIAVKEEKE